MTNESHDRRSGTGIVALSVARFALISLIALVIVAVAIWFASRRVGEREAIANTTAADQLHRTERRRAGDQGAFPDVATLRRWPASMPSCAMTFSMTRSSG